MTFSALRPDFHVIPASPSNYGGTFTPRAIVLHTPEETADQTESTPAWFANPVAGVSTHFYINDDDTPGRVIQMVPGDQRAWHCGVIPEHRPAGFVPIWAKQPEPLLSNYNAGAWGIEVEGRAASIVSTLSLAQYRALVDLVCVLCRVSSITPTRTYIVGHSELTTRRSDPGFPPWLWDALISDVQAQLLLRTARDLLP